MPKLVEMLRVGDPVIWRGALGMAAPPSAIIMAMEVTAEPREKEGTAVSEIPWELVYSNRVVVTLNNSHWAYGEQLSPMVEVPS